MSRGIVRFAPSDRIVESGCSAFHPSQTFLQILAALGIVHPVADDSWEQEGKGVLHSIPSREDSCKLQSPISHVAIHEPARRIAFMGGKGSADPFNVSNGKPARFCEAVAALGGQEVRRDIWCIVPDELERAIVQTHR